MVRPDVPPAERERLEAIGLDITAAHPRDRDALAAACAGSMCVVSALNGVRDVMIDRQGVLLETSLTKAKKSNGRSRVSHDVVPVRAYITGSGSTEAACLFVSSRGLRCN